MSATGADTNASNTSTFVSALVVGCVMVGVFSGVFLIMHGARKFRRVYQSRYYLSTSGTKPPLLPNGIIPWWRTVLSTPDIEVMTQNGPDAYLFLRYVKIFGLYMLVPYIFLGLAVCVPLSAAGPTAGQTGLNILTYGNVAVSQNNRHVGHFLVAIIFIFWTLYLLYKEYEHLVQIRQQWLNSDQHLASNSTKTVMIVNVPADLMDSSKLKEFASVHVPAESITKVWLSVDTKKIEKVYNDRNAECLRLEGGEAKLLALAAKNVKKGKTPAPVTPPKDGEVAPATTEGTDIEANGATESDALISKYILDKKRPKWKQGFLGLIGKKMNLKDSPEFIKEQDAEVQKQRAAKGELKQGNIAFIRFSSQADAHLFAREVKKSKDKKHLFVETEIEVVPEDIVWSNSSLAPAQKKVRTLISWGLTIGLIIVWGPLVTFVGIVSNLDTLCSKAPFLAWLCKLPSAVQGIIKGVLPPVLLAVLFMLLPIFLRIIIKNQGEVRASVIEVKLFSRFWLFQVIHGFLIITIASGLTKAIPAIVSNPESTPTILATQLPAASIFFLTFILASTFSGAAKSYSRAIPMVMYLLQPILGGKTPRKFFTSQHKMMSFGWGTTWPPICLLLCITIVYSVIQPIIPVIAAIAFSLLYIAYKYLLIFASEQPAELETGGLYYVKALKTVFVSLYLMEICMMGLLFLTTDANKKVTPVGLAGGVLMAIMLGVTAATQIWFEWFKFTIPKLAYSNGSYPQGNGNEAKLSQTATNLTEKANPGKASALEEEHVFDHPALWKDTPIIWIADDSLGLGKAEAARLNGLGVVASTQWAHLNADGKLFVERCAPDEEWLGGELETQEES